MLLNLTMLIAVIVMRFAIKSMPNLLPKENLIIIHVLLYTTVTVLWTLKTVLGHRTEKAKKFYEENPTNENCLNFTNANLPYLYVLFFDTTANKLLDFFILYMLHQLSIFTGFVTDPITG